MLVAVLCSQLALINDIWPKFCSPRKLEADFLELSWNLLRAGALLVGYLAPTSTGSTTVEPRFRKVSGKEVSPSFFSYSRLQFHCASVVAQYVPNKTDKSVFATFLVLYYGYNYCFSTSCKWAGTNR